MVREDLITSAVSFLQDPSVANAPLEKRIAFLQSKNLTQEEIDLSLARAEDPNAAPPPPSKPAAQPSHGYRPPQPPPAYGPYPAGYWQQPPPPEPPKRDWRDYFIMATVMGGVGYGLYFTAKRYILPLISPPTPPQLQQDKETIDESFNRAFALLDQLNTDTTALKASEEARTNRLDTALGEVESVLVGLKESSRRQGDDNRRIEDDVRNLRDLIPKAIDAHRESTDNRLKELSTELKSLKTLVANRMGSGTPRPNTATPSNYYGMSQPQTSTTPVNATSTPAAPTPVSTPAPTEQPSTNAALSADAQGSSSSGSGTTPAPAAASTPERAGTPYGKLANGRPAIPVWQMAAAKKAEEKKEEEKKKENGGVSESGKIGRAHV